MKLLVLSIFLSIPVLTTSQVETQEIAALPDYNTYRIHKMRALLEMKTTPKLYILKIA
jgi:hypothetical protein